MNGRGDTGCSYGEGAKGWKQGTGISRKQLFSNDITSIMDFTEQDQMYMIAWQWEIIRESVRHLDILDIFISMHIRYVIDAGDDHVQRKHSP